MDAHIHREAVGIEVAPAAVAVVNAPSRRCIAVEDGASGPSAFGLPWRSGARMTLAVAPPAERQAVPSGGREERDKG
jgi:hypothetical protein